MAVLAAAAIVYLLIEKPWVPRTPPSAAFAPPRHSIAVLPFVNMRGEQAQEYFSDGLAEELLNSLAEISELEVAARTSAFSFKGTTPTSAQSRASSMWARCWKGACAAQITPCASPRS